MTVNVQNVQKLIDFLKGLPDKRFYLGTFFTSTLEPNRFHDLFGKAEKAVHQCGTKACIAGWAVLLLGKEEDYVGAWEWERYGALLLGLNVAQADHLFFGRWNGAASWENATKEQAITHLESCLKYGFPETSDRPVATW